MPRRLGVLFGACTGDVFGSWRGAEMEASSVSLTRGDVALRRVFPLFVKPPHFMLTCTNWLNCS